MSGKSKDPDLNSSAADIASVIEPKKKEKKEKRNYCYVCNVQCSGNRNFIDHNNGKKHEKKLSASTNPERTSYAVKKKTNAQRKVLFERKSDTYNKFKESSHVKSKTKRYFESHSPEEKIPSCASHGSNTHRNRKNPINKDIDFPDMVQNHYDKRKYDNTDYPPSNNYIPPLLKEPFYHNPQYQPFSSWNHFPNSRPHLQTGNYYSNYGYYPVPNFNSNQSTVRPDFNPYHLVNNRHLSNQETSPDKRSDFYNKKESESEKTLSPTDDVNNSSIPSTSVNTSPNSSKNDLKCISPIGTDVCTEAFQALSSDEKQKSVEEKRVCSKSISSSEGSHSEKEDENQNTEPDGTVDQQKIKAWTNTLLETNHGQISRLIHPSNYKDKAAVNHLITNLSKSKKKETLSRLKLRSNSLCSTGTNEDCDTEIPDDKGLEPVAVVLNSKEVTSTPDILDAQHLPLISNSKNEEGNEELCNDNDSSSDKRCDKSRNKNSSPKKDRSNMIADIEKTVKRKTNVSTNNRTKKQRYFNENVEEVSANNEKDLSSNKVVDESLTHNGCFEKHMDIDDTPDVKEEVPDSQAEKPAETSFVASTENCQPQGTNTSSGFSIDTLINLFASGSVTVLKKELNDPVIEALKTLDHNELLNACSSKSSLINPRDAERSLNATSSARLPEDTPDTDKDSSRCISPVILGSTVIGDSSPRVAVGQSTSDSLLNPVNLVAEDQRCSSVSSNLNDNSLCGVEDIDFMTKHRSEFSPHLKKLVKQLREISTQEETVKQGLQETRCKISEYQELLVEWKNKKKKLQVEEEHLRKRRIDIIELMQNAVKTTTEPTDTEKEASASPRSVHQDQNLSSETSKCPIQPSVQEKNSTHSSSIQTELTPQQKKKPQSSDSEEVQVLSIKTEEPELIVIDGDDSNEKQIGGSKDLRDGFSKDASISNKGPSIFGKKHLEAHKTVINCLQVFEDCLYTCSNDSTGKRFNLKNHLDTVTYLHSGKNVTEIVVEKVQSEALVFTACSNRISLFIASNGTRIKTFCQTCAIMSICKGWGKFYSGMADGTINVYNYKYEEKEIMKSERPASRIASAHQGRLHVLIILSADSNISVRDADTGLLIQYIKGFVKLPSWLTIYNDLAYLSSSDKTLTILDIMTGRAEKKLYISGNITGLAVYEDYIFTISYSGMVNCYNKEKISDRKLYYGAGKNGLTCIYVYQDWVFTGNRKGDVSFFKFEPKSSAKCQFSQCSYIFGLPEDLYFHVEKDHLTRRKTLAKCCWGVCNYLFPPCDIKNKMTHMKTHIAESFENTMD